MQIVTVIIDMQEDFFLHERLQKNRNELSVNINELTALSRELSVPVVWVRQEYAPDLQDAPLEVRKNNRRIVIAGSHGAKILSELDVQSEDTVVVKNRYSAFFNSGLEEVLTKKQCTAVAIAGINSHACVRASAVDAFQRDYKVLLLSECIDSYDMEHHIITMKYLNEQIGRAITNDQFRQLHTLVGDV